LFETFGAATESNAYAITTPFKTKVHNNSVYNEAEIVINCDSAIDDIMGNGAVMSIFSKGLKRNACKTI